MYGWRWGTLMRGATPAFGPQRTGGLSMNYAAVPSAQCSEGLRYLL